MGFSNIRHLLASHEWFIESNHLNLQLLVINQKKLS